MNSLIKVYDDQIYWNADDIIKEREQLIHSDLNMCIDKAQNVVQIK
jgi:hypothetical protein